MSTRIATGVGTENWYSLVEYLKNDGWKLTAEYNQFDKGIDFDLYEFKKGNKKILMAWDNWFEGEIKCEMELVKDLELRSNSKFKFGTPEHLSVNILEKLKNLLASSK